MLPILNYTNSCFQSPAAASFRCVFVAVSGTELD